MVLDITVEWVQILHEMLDKIRNTNQHENFKSYFNSLLKSIKTLHCEGKDNDRKKKLTELVLYNNPICLFESKHRLLKLLRDINEIFGQETQIGIFRELTKVYETIIHDSVSNLINYYSENPPKGEFVIIISSKSLHKAPDKNYLIIYS